MSATKYLRSRLWQLILFGVFVTACNGENEGRDPILGIDDHVAAVSPRVTAVTPVHNATGVPINNTLISATFSEPMAPLSDPANFTVTCDTPCANPGGTVALNADATIATYTLSDGTSLEPLTLYTGTVAGATSRANGRAMLGPFVWQFTTGSTTDTTRPRVANTFPATTDPGPTPDVPANSAISATFTEDIAPATVNPTSFTLTCVSPCVSPAGTVSYSVGSRTAVFTPDAVLEESVTYTATLTTQIKDLAGNELAGNQAPLPAASDYVWSFTTTATTAPSNISITSIVPADSATGVCPNTAVSATFDVPSGLRLDPDTVTSVTFSVIGPSSEGSATSGSTRAVTDGVPVLAASVSLDPATGTVAAFIPLNDLNPGDTYTVVVQGLDDGVKDLALPANIMLSDFFSTFTVGPAENRCLEPVALQSAAPYGVFGGSAGMTNTGIQTIVNGDIGTIATDTTSITGFHDANDDVYTETSDNIGTVNGLIYTCTTSTTGPTSTAVNAASCDKATDARFDAEAAFLELAGLPGGPDPGAGNLANLTLPPGVYTAESGAFKIEGGDLTLDAQGDTSAVWVFQMATTLTVGGPGADFPQNIILVNGAQARNVFWQVGSAATINAAGGGTMAGTIITQDGVSFSTVGNTNIVTLNGRALSLDASVTLVDTVINVPAP